MNIPLTATLTTIASLVLLNCSVEAQVLTQTTTAPTTNVVISQADFSGGTHSNADYSNQPTPGQTFTAPSSFTMTDLTLKGASSNNSDNGDGNFHLQIGSLNANGTTITPLETESFAVTNVAANTNNYFTFTLANSVAMTAGTVYTFSIYTAANNFYFGFANSQTDVYSGGTAFTNTNTGSFSNSVNATYAYDRTFFVEGTGAMTGTPEPGTVTVCVIAAGALLLQLRRRGFLKN